MPDATVPVEDLRAAGFGDEVEKVATAVAAYLDDGTGQNVAVISEPYAGRDALLEYARSLLEAEETATVELDTPAASGTAPSLPDAGALFVPDCHALFERRIDGFEALESFLDELALSDRLVVTSWNRYAWAYLDAVRDVSEAFHRQVRIPRLDADEIETAITHRYGPELPAFVDTGSAGRVKTLDVGRYPVGLPGDRTIEVPYPRPNLAWTASWSVRGEDESVQAVVFEKIRRVSNGNPGVAQAIWEESVTDGEIAPGYIEAPSAHVAVDEAQGLLLWHVLARESMPVDRLTAVVDEQGVELHLQALVDGGLLAVEDGVVTVPRDAIHLADDAVGRRQLLW